MYAKVIPDVPEIFRYNDIEVPPNCIHKISPSQIGKFFEYPKLYFEDNIAGGTPTFQGNTSTVLGTICHHIYKCVALNIPVTREEINDQLETYARLRPELELDVNEIITNYPLITEVVVNNYLLRQPPSKIVEKQVLTQIHKTNVYVGGTFDRLEDDGTLVDFKTVATKPTASDPDSTIPFNYKIQLLAYAYCLRKQGFDVSKIRVVYGVKPTKTIGARVYPVTNPIDYQSEELIKETLDLITESVLLCKNQPELTYIIFKSMKLKAKT